MAQYRIAINPRKGSNLHLNEELLSHLSPSGQEHTNLTGDCIWRNNKNWLQGNNDLYSQSIQKLNVQNLPFPKWCPFLHCRANAQRVANGVTHFGAIQRIEVEIFHPFAA